MAAQPAKRLVPVHGREARQPVLPAGEQPQKGRSQRSFGVIKGRKIHGGHPRCGVVWGGRGRGSWCGGRRHALPHHPLGGSERIEARGDQFHRDVQDFGGVADQVRRG
jgi:hypothetical protein